MTESLPEARIWSNDYANRITPEADMQSDRAAALFGTTEPPAASELVAAGALDLLIEAGAPRRMRFAGTEFLRRIDHPLRNADWGTLPLVETDATLTRSADGFDYSRGFATAAGEVSGTFRLTGTTEADGARLTATFEATAQTALDVNRIGFTLLHPIAGLGGAPLTVTHPDGTSTDTRFPEHIAPAQPARDIAGLSHAIGPLAVTIRMEGEVFEMEDQRNWTDASFKTYCRPLSLPRPFRLEAGDTVHQRITIEVRRRPEMAASATRQPPPTEAILPAICLAHEPALTGPDVPAPVRALPVAALQLRLAAEDPLPPPATLPDAPVALEILLAPGADPAASFARLAAACADAGLHPARVTALPAPYLASHQPDGPWPDGPTPADLIAPLRAAFPGLPVGSGALTNFTEFNRCRPDPAAIDFATFGTTAIVHAADDRSVLETLEALPDVFASARAIAGTRPLHLGLVTIGTRSNPYGAAVAANPARRRVEMALDDPRHTALFGAAWAIAATAEAATSGIASLALAMTSGPLGLTTGPESAPRVTPLFHVVRALAALGGATAQIDRSPEGLVTLLTDRRSGLIGLAAHLGDTPAILTPPAGARLVILSACPPAATAPDWLDHAPRTDGPIRLAPFEIAFLTAPDPAP